MKVYAVLELINMYDEGQRLLGVFSTKEQAEEYLKLKVEDYGFVEEYEIDNPGA